MLGATGAVLEAVGARARGAGHAFAAVRPPGHHALADRVMGFCLVNNAVVAARRFQALGRRRVLIVDWDVHHGNGTQALVEHDADIRFVSLHQWPWWPGTGAAAERGVGNVFNVPLPGGLVPEQYVRELWRAVEAATHGLDAGRDHRVGGVRRDGGGSARRVHAGAAALPGRSPSGSASGCRACRSSGRSRAGTCPVGSRRARRRSWRRWRRLDKFPAPHSTGSIHAASPGRIPRAPHQAPLHHRPRRAERLPDRLGEGDRRRRERGLGRGGADQVLRRDLRDRHGDAAGVRASTSAPTPSTSKAIDRRLETVLKGNPSARAAISAALHDLVGKRLGVPVYKLWGLDPAKAPMSTFTIGIDTAERIRMKVEEAAEYPILKIKLGSDRDLEILRTIRERHRPRAPGGRQRRLDRQAHPADAAGARGVRRDGAGAAAGADRPRGAGRHPPRRVASRSSPTSRCRTASDIPALGGPGGRHQHQAGQVRQPAGGAPDDRHRARPPHDGHGRLHDRELARHHGGGALHAAGGYRGPRRRRAALRWTPSSAPPSRAASSASPPDRGSASRRDDRTVRAGRASAPARHSLHLPDSRDPGRPRGGRGARRGAGARAGTDRDRHRAGRARRPTMAARAILGTPDTEPALHPALLKTVEWMAGYYGAPIGLALKAALPAGLWGEFARSWSRWPRPARCRAAPAPRSSSGWSERAARRRWRRLRGA